MTRKPAHYLEMAKAFYGNPGMSDRELGERLGGLTAGYIGKAKFGNMSDNLALKLEQLLKIAPGEVIMVARAYREKDEEVKAALQAWVGKALALMPEGVEPPKAVFDGMRASLVQRAKSWRTDAEVPLAKNTI